jgi:hypothetical protein
MSNTTIPLVILTWLCQRQEHFFKQSEIKESIDWNDFGQYCNVPLKYAVTKGVNNVHMSKANTENAVKSILLTASNQTEKILKSCQISFRMGREDFVSGKSLCAGHSKIN